MKLVLSFQRFYLNRQSRKKAILNRKIAASTLPALQTLPIIPLILSQI